MDTNTTTPRPESIGTRRLDDRGHFHGYNRVRFPAHGDLSVMGVWDHGTIKYGAISYKGGATYVGDIRNRVFRHGKGILKIPQDRHRVGARYCSVEGKWTMDRIRNGTVIYPEKGAPASQTAPFPTKLTYKGGIYHKLHKKSHRISHVLPKGAGIVTHGSDSASVSAEEWIPHPQDGCATALNAYINVKGHPMCLVPRLPNATSRVAIAQHSFPDRPSSITRFVKHHLPNVRPGDPLPRSLFDTPK